MIALVDHWDDHLLGLAAPGAARAAAAACRSKLQAVRNATAVGENVIIANGKLPGVIDGILAGQEIGTLFLAKGAAIPAWKRWIGYTVPPEGVVRWSTRGARKAVETAGKSLLAIGITAVEGTFGKGEVVSLCDVDGAEFARGLTNYASDEAARILGQRTPEIARSSAGCRTQKSFTATTWWCCREQPVAEVGRVRQADSGILAISATGGSSRFPGFHENRRRQFPSRAKVFQRTEAMAPLVHLHHQFCGRPRTMIDTVSSFFNYYVASAKDYWNHLTPVKYGFLLVLVFLAGYVLLKSKIRKT